MAKHLLFDSNKYINKMFSQIWIKVAKVIPRYDQENKDDPANHCLISFFSSLGKVREKIKQKERRVIVLISVCYAKHNRIVGLS